MRPYSGYSWLHSYFDNDSFWLEDIISWDETFELFLSDYNIFFLLTSPFFINVHFFLDSLVKMSFVDAWLLSESESYHESRELYIFVMWDTLSCLSTNFFFSQALYYTDSQDFFVILMHHSPELSGAICDFLESHWFNKVTSWLPLAEFDSYLDFMRSHLDELAKYGFLFIALIWAYVGEPVFGLHNILSFL